MKYFIIFLFFQILCLSAWATIINVPADTASIQGGINLATTGDTVLVQPGTYIENINFNGKNIVVGSLILTTGDTSYISQTIISADTSIIVISTRGSVVTLENGEDTTAVLSGFTITNGGAPGGGGGIHINNSSPSIYYLIITDNVVGEHGGGIYLENSAARISHSKILSNTAWRKVGFGMLSGLGGGIYCYNSNPILDAMEIKDNSAALAGGGIYFINSNPILNNVEIMHNSGGDGGGIYCDSSNIVLNNVTITGNNAHGHSSMMGAGPGIGGGICLENNSNAVFNNVIIKGNTNAAGGNGEYPGPGGGLYCSNSTANLLNVTISNNSASHGGGIFTDSSNIYLSNVSITNNHAAQTAWWDGTGGGIHISSFSSLNFDPNNRCNIYNNYAESSGSDLYSQNESITAVIVYTFTVLNPTNYEAYPIEKFSIDILNAKNVPVNSDLYVSPFGNDGNSGLSQAEPLKTIHYAMNIIMADSTNPHTIYLTNGIYSPSNTGEIFPINIRSCVSLEGETANGTILDAENLFSGVITSNANKGFTINNLTIKRGFWGGITLTNSVLNISNISIIEDKTYAIRCSDSKLNITDAIISNNYLGLDHFNVVECLYSHVEMTNVTISDNSGTGLRCKNSNLEITNVTISDNRGGIGLTESTLKMVNTILWNNYLTFQYGQISLNLVTISNSDLEGGLGGINYGGNGTVYWLGGNINADPMFVDTANGDYRLQAGSPCIDAGIQDTMIVYNNGQDTLYVPAMNYMGSAPDMGAFEFESTSIQMQETNGIPEKYALSQNYPNPFNPSTVIKFDLPKTSRVTLKIINILGEEVVTLVSDRLSTGSYSYEWDASQLASGVYLYKLQAGDYTETKKMFLIR